MDNEIKKIADDALLLTDRQRAALAHILISSLDNESREDVERAWELELERRVSDILAGKVRGIPAAEVFAKLREKHH